MLNHQACVDKMAQNVVQLLNEHKQKVASVESCTGGMISAAITSVAGSSQVFDLGICTYANWAKHNFVFVPTDTLDKYGAVSRQTAIAMAEGIRKAAGADFGISTTGIAGPDGGTAEKPVGTVYVGCSSKLGTAAVNLAIDTENINKNITDIRDYVRKETTKKALEILLNTISQCYSD